MQAVVFNVYGVLLGSHFDHDIDFFLNDFHNLPAQMEDITIKFLAKKAKVFT